MCRKPADGVSEQLIECFRGAEYGYFAQKHQVASGADWNIDVKKALSKLLMPDAVWRTASGNGM